MEVGRVKNAFFSAHRQGFIRAGVCTPRIHVGDPRANAIDDLFLQDTLLDGVERAIASVRDATRGDARIVIVGAPLRRNQRLYNCAVVLTDGRILGVVPKTFLPNYREFYENRWFAPG